MPKFLAVTSRGLHKALLDEMTQKKFKTLNKTASGVEFSGSWKECYRANLILKCTPRILKPILDFSAYNKEDFYNNAKKHDFTKYIRPNQTLAVQSSVQGEIFTDQRYPSLLLKDVVVDQFQEKFDQRPSVDKDHPDLSLFVKVYKNQVSISLDTTGFSLSQRGYRQQTIVAPIKEHLAAATLMLSRWQPGEAIYDPMCGTGTFLVEAAKWQSLREDDFGFMRWQSFQPQAYKELLAELKKSKETGSGFFMASDLSDQNVDIAAGQFRRAGIADVVNLFSMNYFHLNSEKLKLRLRQDLPETGLIIINPPYDKRIKIQTPLEKFYDQIVLKSAELFPGWRLSLIVPADFDERAMKCTVDSQARFESGGFKTKLLRFPNLKRYLS